MSNMHPKAIEALKRHEEKLEVQRKLDHFIDRMNHVAGDLGLKFWHRLPVPANPPFGTGDMRGMTVAYAVQRRNIISIGTTICHPNDNFSKKMGKALATQNFSIGHNIDLHMPARFGGNVHAFLDATFGD